MKPEDIKNIAEGVKDMQEDFVSVKADRDLMKTELDQLKETLADIEAKGLRVRGDAAMSNDEAVAKRKELRKEAMRNFISKGRHADEFVEYMKSEYGAKQIDYASNFNTIEEEMSKDILEYAINNSAFLMGIGNYMVGSVEHRRPILDPATRPTVEQTGENNNAPSTNPAVTTTQEYVFVRAQFAKLYAMPALTHEMILDSHLDLEAELLRLIGEEWTLKLQDMIMFGNGDTSGSVDNLRGFLNFRVDRENQFGTGSAFGEARKADSARSVECFQIMPTTVDGAFGADAEAIENYFIDVQVSLHHRYTAGSKWYFNRRTFAELKKVLRDNERRPLIEWVGLDMSADAENSGYSLLGSPIVICDALEDQGANALAGIYGELSRAQSMIPLAGSEHTIIDEITNKGQKLIYRDMRIGEIVGDNQSVRVLFQGS